MQTAVLRYRIFRLRRLLAVLTLPFLLVAITSYLVGYWIVFALSIFAVAAMVWHILRFPNAWQESIAMCLTLLTALILAVVLIGVDSAFSGSILWLIVFVIGAPILFMMLSSRVPRWVFFGQPADRTYVARRKSRLTAAELAPSTALRSGFRDAFVECGEADAEGWFDVTYHHVGTAFFDGSTYPAPVEFQARVASDEDGTTVVVARVDGADASVTTTILTPLRRGTRVELREEATMVTGLRMGYWLGDKHADFLTDVVDRAEGRPMRANRFQPEDTLMAMLASRFVRRRWADAPQQDDIDDAEQGPH